MPIAFIDSGIGGLSLLAECILSYPGDYLYIADTKYMPYGNKSAEFLLERKQILTSFAQSHKSSCVVYACNTLCTLNQPILMSSHFESVSITEQLVTRAVAKTRNKRIGILGTLPTVQSNYFADAIKKMNGRMKVVQQACPALAPAIEQRRDVIDLINLTKHYLDPVVYQNVDTLILACTHYPLIKDIFSELIGDVALIYNDSSIINDVYIPAIKASSITLCATGDENQLRKAIDHYVPILVPFIKCISRINI